MRELYEDLKRTLLDHQKDVMYKKEEFKGKVKGITKDAKEYRIQLNEYDETINRNISVIDKKLKNLKED